VSGDSGTRVRFPPPPPHPPQRRPPREARELHGANRELPAVAITSYGSAENRAHVEAAGFYGFFVKPPEFDRFSGAIARLVQLAYTP